MKKDTKKFLFFLFLLNIIGFFSLFVHEGVHFLECYNNNGKPILVFNPELAQKQFGFFGFGNMGATCSGEYSNTSIKHETRAGGSFFQEGENILNN